MIKITSLFLLISYILIGIGISESLSDKINKYGKRKRFKLYFLCVYAWPFMIIAGIIKDKL